jgi:hypothetical protein
VKRGEYAKPTGDEPAHDKERGEIETVGGGAKSGSSYRSVRRACGLREGTPVRLEAMTIREYVERHALSAVIVKRGKWHPRCTGYRNLLLVERVGFEPTARSPRRRFSRPVHSTALPPLRFLPQQHLAWHCPLRLSRFLGSMCDVHVGVPNCMPAARQLAAEHLHMTTPTEGEFRPGVDRAH